MSYTLSLGSIHVISDGFLPHTETCTCQQARDWCAPSFVFSIAGQVGFRVALRHLAQCRRQECRSLRRRVIDAMTRKLRWLLEEECLLGCVHVQPTLYGSRKIVMQRRDWPTVAMHLAKCPKESCAQLRRAVLLNIRDSLRPQHDESLTALAH